MPIGKSGKLPEWRGGRPRPPQRAAGRAKAPFPPQSPALRDPLPRLDPYALFLGVLEFLVLCAFAVRYGIGYDGWWHVFIADQDRWSDLLFELKNNFHPPIYFLLLKIPLAITQSVLSYRLIGILAASMSAVLMAWILQQCRFNRWTSYLAALSFGLSLPFVGVALEVRSYMTAAVFELAALLFLLRTPKRANLYLAYSLFCTLAVLTHYSAIFFVAASCFALFTPALRKRVSVGIRSGIALSVPFLVFGLLYWSHFQSYANPIVYLPSHYLRSDAADSLPDFLTRNAWNLANVFSPLGRISIPLNVLFLSAFLVCLFLGFLKLRQWPERSLLLICFLVLLFLALGGVMGKHPFGGALRHQFVAYPLIFLVIVLVVHKITQTRRVALLAAFSVFVVLSVAGLVLVPIPVEDHDYLERRSIQEPGEFNSVYVDQYSLIFFFARHPDWRWFSLGPCQPDNNLAAYVLVRGEDEILLLRDKHVWNTSFETERRLYDELTRCVGRFQPAGLTIYHRRQFPPAQPLEAYQSRTREALRSRLSGYGIGLKQIRFFDHHFLAELNL